MTYHVKEALVPPKSQTCTSPVYATARSFVTANSSYAQQIASQLNTTPGNILGLSGNESGWGTGFLISAGTNNYFSLTAGKAFTGTIGTYQHGGYTYGVYPAPGFLTSGQSFANSYFGNRVNGIKDPSAFAQALNANGNFNSELLKRPYNIAIANTINLAKVLLTCH
jgi:hypothetical protein